VRGAPAAEYVVETLKNFSCIGLPEGKKLNCPGPGVNADQNVSVAIHVRFTERDYVDSIGGERSTMDGAYAGEDFPTGRLDFLTDRACCAVAFDFFFDPCSCFTVLQP
jgi:hypothetical protein